jgi:beta-N-acetylhexosaminidase
VQPAIYGLARERLGDDERAFFRDADPAGYILFKRNCTDRDQLRALTEDLRAIHGRPNLPILIDQEGGRVARMKPPAWPEFPSGGRFAELYRVAPMSAIEAARANAGAIAALLREVGINVDCLPVLDVRQPGATEIVGDRSLGSDPMQVAALGRSMLDGLREGGVVGVIKHMPGHGRAMSDSHVELPLVDAGEDALEIDLEPFVSLRNAPMGMMAHVLYSAWDDERPASQSPIVIEAIVRGRIGFDGLLMSDDIGMQALKGDFAQRTDACLAAGCDIALHCSGVMEEMVQVASVADEISDKARERLERAMGTIADSIENAPYEELAAKRDELLAMA